MSNDSFIRFSTCVTKTYAKAAFARSHNKTVKLDDAAKGINQSYVLGVLENKLRRININMRDNEDKLANKLYRDVNLHLGWEMPLKKRRTPLGMKSVSPCKKKKEKKSGAK